MGYVLLFIALLFFAFLFGYKLFYYRRRNINRASYYLSGLILILLFTILYILNFIVDLSGFDTSLVYIFLCMFYVVAVVAVVFVVRYVAFYLLNFMREINRK